MKQKAIKKERDDTVDEAVPEFMAGMVDELEYIPRNERLGRAGRLKRNSPQKMAADHCFRRPCPDCGAGHCL